MSGHGLLAIGWAGIGMTMLLVGCSVAPPRPQNLARGDFDAVRRHVTELIRYEMDKNSLVGLSIAVVDDQRIVWAEGFGHADREHSILATADTVYRVGSIAKLFTATAAMQLAEQGRLDIDQPLQKYLPAFSIRTRFVDAAPITPRQLMTHHAGLPRDLLKGMWNPQPQPYTSLVGTLKDSYTAYPPDTILSYSNVGATLLGHAIENVAGRPFPDHLRQTLLLPLSMTNSSFSHDAAESPFMAKAYRKGRLAVDPSLRDVPAGGLNSSVIDLGRFLEMLFADGKSPADQSRILKPETVAEMLRPQNAAIPLDVNFHIGLGWMLSTLGTTTLENAGPVVHHGGATILFRSQLYALPEHKLGVVVLSNTSSDENVVDRIAVRALALTLEATSGIRQTETKPAAPADPAWPRDVLEKYVGDYATMLGLVRIQMRSGGLRAEAMGRSFALIPRSDGQLGLEYALFGLLPIKLGALDDIGLTLRHIAGHDRLVARIKHQDMLVGQRIEAAPDLGRWRQRLGAYRIIDLDTDHPFINSIRLSEERGLLLAEITTPEDPETRLRLPLTPVSDEDAIILNPGPLSGGGETLHCATADVHEECRYSGYTIVRMPLESGAEKP